MIRAKYSVGALSDDSEASVDLTPMLDVVFIMLIFFIVTASFVKEAGVEVNRPTAATSSTKPAMASVVAIDDNNRVWIEGREVDVRRLGVHLQRLLAQSTQSAVIVQADKAASVERLTQVLDAARELVPQDRISLATQKL